MHRLGALIYNGRCVEEEEDRRTAVLVAEVVRRRSVNREIAGLDCVRVDRVANVDSEVSRLGVYDATASWVSRGDRKANQISVGKGILLGSAANGHAPVHP